MATDEFERGDTFWISEHQFRGKHFVVVNTSSDEMIDSLMSSMLVVDQKANEYTFRNMGERWDIHQPNSELTVAVDKESVVLTEND